VRDLARSRRIMASHAKKMHGRCTDTNGPQRGPTSVSNRHSIYDVGGFRYLAGS
jgi:hypothetical protein